MSRKVSNSKTESFNTITKKAKTNKGKCRIYWYSVINLEVSTSQLSGYTSVEGWQWSIFLLSNFGISLWVIFFGAIDCVNAACMLCHRKRKGTQISHVSNLLTGTLHGYVVGLTLITLLSI